MQKMTMMYYPFVHPPRPVLWQALLYWDALTTRLSQLWAHGTWRWYPGGRC